MKSSRRSYHDLETEIKDQTFQFRKASIADLTFHYFWPLIGFYSRKEKGNYFESQKTIVLDPGSLKKQDLISEKIKLPINRRTTAHKSNKKILIFQSDRTQTVIEGLDEGRYLLDDDESLLHPPRNDLKITKDELDEIEEFCHFTIKIFDHHHMHLSTYDAQFLKSLVIKVVLDHLRAYLRLLLNLDKISLIITHADNHPPFIFWIVAAKILRVPTLMLQHGLDCEPFFLDDAYADYIAVWGEQRLERYLKRSRLVPKEIRVTGNPNYDRLTQIIGNSTDIDDGKNIKIAYIGRPHHIEKNYFHLRDDLKVKMIFDDLFAVSQIHPSIEIICRLHPYDDREYFEALIDECASQNIKITDKSIYELLPEIDAVISEDSTGAVEAMMYSKPLMLLHYEDSEPIVRPDKYDAGILVKDPSRFFKAFEELMESIKDNSALLQKNQDVMVSDHLGSLDGDSTLRVISFIDDILTARPSKREEITFCSVVTKDYLKYADALYRSLKKENGDVLYKVLVIDDEEIWSKEFGFDIVRLSDLNIPMIEHMVVYYDAFELSCALKPFLIDHLFKSDHEKVVFLDSDIFITGDFFELSGFLDSHDVVFTSHYNDSPPMDGLYPDEPQIALYGVLNGGFWAMRRSLEAERVLEWFMEKMTVYGFHEPEKGMTGDQPMITVATILFDDDITILKRPQYNIAYWNMHERIISYRNGKFYADKEESVFFHLSRFKETRPERFTIDDGHRVTTESHPVTKDIISEYVYYLSEATSRYEQHTYGFTSYMGRVMDKQGRRDYFDLVRSKVFDFLNRDHKFNILFLADGRFWEMDNGSKARLVSVVRYLKESYDVKILFLGSIKKEEWVKITELSLEENTVGLFDMEKTFLTEYKKEVPSKYRPISRYLRNKNITDHFYTYVKTHHIDVCVVEYIRWTHLTDCLDENTITILDMHDMMYRRCEKLTEKGISHWIEISKDQEFALFEQFDHIMAIQTEEVKELKASGMENVLYTPYAIDIKKQDLNKSVKKITYVAGKNEVNDQAILWFLENVWIYYIQVYKSVRLHVYGTVCETLREYSHYGLVLHGKVDDLDEAYFGTDIVINPIHLGGGLKIKSVEALSNSLPLITTQEGAGGMEDGINSAFAVVKDADEFLTMLIAISESEALRLKMADKAYEYAKKNFSLDNSYASLDQLLESFRQRVVK